MGMETTGKAKDNLEDLWVDPFNYRDLLSAAVRHLSRRNVRASIFNLPLCILPDHLWTFARKSISTWKEIYFPDCEDCYLKDICGGNFGTNYKNSAFVRPLNANDISFEWKNKIDKLTNI